MFIITSIFMVAKTLSEKSGKAIRLHVYTSDS